jgi:hypothetical protein
MMNAFTLPANVKLQPLLICIVSWASAAFAAPNAKPKHNSATRFIGASPSVMRIDRQRQPNLGTNQRRVRAGARETYFGAVRIAFTSQNANQVGDGR